MIDHGMGQEKIMNRDLVDDLKQIGLCLATCLILLLIHCEATIGAVQKPKEPMATNPFITWQNERLTVRARAVPLQDLLETIAKTCDLRIFSASADKTTALVDVDMHERTIEQTLKELLRGCNYLVIYNESTEKIGLVSSFNSTRRDDQAGAKASHPETVPPSIQEEEIERVRFQIEMLSERIASGASDRFYENAIKFREPAFVQDDRQVLARYQERLAKLEGNI